MAYQTGTANSMAILKTALETFCTTYGWTLTGGVLYKGNSYVALSLPDEYRLQINAAASADFLTDPCPYAFCLYVTDSYPVTYHFFLHENPDTVVCVIHYDTTRIQVMMFGDMVKINETAFDGGNFFYASRSELGYTKIPALYYITDSNIASTYFYDISSHKATMFMPWVSKFPYTSPYKGIRVNIDGNVWDSVGNCVLTDSAISSYHRSPNQWDSQSHLIPMQLQYAMADSLWGYLGYIEHIRLVRVTNYNIGDVLEITPDKWKIFPWVQKETTYPDGRTGSSQFDEQAALQASGTLGFAVRYDGA